MICRRYGACMRWLYGYLAYWGMVAAVAWLVLEGLKMNNVLWTSRANKSNCKLFLGGKWLLRLIYWLWVKIPEGYWSWVAMWGWPDILWSEVHDYLPIGLTVLRKPFLEPYMLGMEVTYIKGLWSFVPYSWRSGIWQISWAKISNFFCGRNWDKIFWEINSLPDWIL